MRPLDPQDPVTSAIHIMASRTRDPHTLPLTFGGELSLSEHDGDYQLRIDVDGGHFAIRLSGLDVWGIRQLTGAIVRDRAAEMAEEVA